MLLRCPLVFPVSGPPIRDGVVVVRNGRIQAVDPARTFATAGRDDLIELPGTALLPGLVNAHTHLELSGLAGRIPKPPSFAAWLRQMIAWRIRSRRWPWWRWNLKRALRRGLGMSIAAGTTLVGDVSASHQSPAVLGRAPIRSVAFLEVLGRDDDTAGEKGRQLWEAVQPGARDHMRLAVSPHAPYSTGRALYEFCDVIARRQPCQLATHLAESPEEIEFCTAGTGPLRELFDELGVMPEGWEPPGRRPIPLVASYGVFGRSILVAHANYVDDADVRVLRESGSAVVYCPRSHAYFGHEPHPLVALREAGVPVALGTDSLASAPSLSVLDEMRFLRESRPDLADELILELGTLGGATALRSERRLGTVEPHKRADLVVVELGAEPGENPYEALWHPDTRVVLSLVDGGVAHDPRRLVPRPLQAEAAVGDG